MSERTHITLVGHCGADGYLLRNALRSALEDADVADAHSDADLLGLLEQTDLLLVNRVLDGNFEVGLGQELIRKLNQIGSSPAMMLVSNFDDAQAEAVDAGALPGFGKSALHDEDTQARLRAAVS